MFTEISPLFLISQKSEISQTFASYRNSCLPNSPAVSILNNCLFVCLPIIVEFCPDHVQLKCYELLFFVMSSILVTFLRQTSSFTIPNSDLCCTSSARPLGFIWVPPTCTSRLESISKESRDRNTPHIVCYPQLRNRTLAPFIQSLKRIISYNLSRFIIIHGGCLVWGQLTYYGEHLNRPIVKMFLKINFI